MMSTRSANMILARLMKSQVKNTFPRQTQPFIPQASTTSRFSSSNELVLVSQIKAPLEQAAKKEEEKVVIEACGDVDDDDDDELEQEEMFVDAHPSFDHQSPEWGGPRRGGRLPEPTRYGDWERKGRCTDF